LEKMSYKTFVWPQNPHTYREEYLRDPHYLTEDGVKYYRNMGEKQFFITGEGSFFGETAYEDFRRLIKVFEDMDPGNLEHPVWGIRYCYFTGLELTQEPKENCISYRFTFTGAKTNGELPV